MDDASISLMALAAALNAIPAVGIGDDFVVAVQSEQKTSGTLRRPFKACFGARVVLVAAVWSPGRS